MGMDGTPQAAWGAAVLGSRNARRQVRAALAHAHEMGAYSVGFTLGRGGLAGFTIYLSGNCTGRGAKRPPQGMAATSAMPPPSGMVRPAAGQMQPRECAAVSRGQRPSQLVTGDRPVDVHDVQPQADDKAQARDAPAGRRRGCRAGARRRRRRDAPAPAAVCAPQRPPRAPAPCPGAADVQPQGAAQPQDNVRPRVRAAATGGDKKRKAEHGAAIQRPEDKASPEEAPRPLEAGCGALGRLTSGDQGLYAHMGPMGGASPKRSSHSRPLSFSAPPFFPHGQNVTYAFAPHGRS